MKKDSDRREGRNNVGLNGCPVDEFFGHILVFSPLRGVLANVVGKEKDFQNHKDDEKLDEDDDPERAPQCHAAKTVVIQTESPLKKVALCHSREFVGKDNGFL